MNNGIFRSAEEVAAAFQRAVSKGILPQSGLLFEGLKKQFVFYSRLGPPDSPLKTHSRRSPVAAAADRLTASRARKQAGGAEAAGTGPRAEGDRSEGGETNAGKKKAALREWRYFPLKKAFRPQESLPAFPATTRFFPPPPAAPESDIDDKTGFDLKNQEPGRSENPPCPPYQGGTAQNLPYKEGRRLSEKPDLQNRSSQISGNQTAAAPLLPEDSNQTGINHQPAPSPLLPEAFALRIANGSLPQNLPEGVKVWNRRSFLKEGEAPPLSVQEKILGVLGEKRDGLCCLNNLFAEDILILSVEKSLLQPLEIQFLSGLVLGEAGVSQASFRLFVFVKEGVKAEIFETFHKIRFPSSETAASSALSADAVARQNGETAKIRHSDLKIPVLENPPCPPYQGGTAQNPPYQGGSRLSEKPDLQNRSSQTGLVYLQTDCFVGGRAALDYIRWDCPSEVSGPLTGGPLAGEPLAGEQAGLAEPGDPQATGKEEAARERAGMEAKGKSQEAQTESGRRGTGGAEAPEKAAPPSDAGGKASAARNRAAGAQSGGGSSLLNRLFGHIERGAEARFLTISLHAGLSRFETVLRQKEKSRSEIRGFSLLSGRGSAEHRVSVFHLEKEGESNQLYQSLVLDSAKHAFKGLISIAKGAQKTKANQLSGNRLLGEKPFCAVSPELDVLADDVKANHGASVASAEESREALFYLQSRGLSRSKALELITEGAVHAALAVSKEKTRRAVFARIRRSLQETAAEAS